MSYNILIDGKLIGPLSEHDFRSYVASGKLKATDSFMGHGSKEWAPGSAAESFLNSARAPMPPSEYHSHLNENDELQCIKCGSTQLHSGPRGYSFMRGGIFGSAKVVITCLKCGQKFWPGGDPY